MPWRRIGDWRYSSKHSLTSALDGSEWSASRPDRFTPRERAPGTHWIGGWLGLRAVLDAVVKRKIPSPRRESNPRTSIVQPVARRYTDWAITVLLETILSPFSSVLMLTYYFLKIHRNVILWRRPTSPKCSLFPSGFPEKNDVHLSQAGYSFRQFCLKFCDVIKYLFT
jgi:hypothetical protein